MKDSYSLVCLFRWKMDHADCKFLATTLTFSLKPSVFVAYSVGRDASDSKVRHTIAPAFDRFVVKQFTQEFHDSVLL